jgi:hypothetical protein
VSISEFFNKKARAAAAAAAIALGGAGGYAGHEIAQHQLQPQPSNFVLSQLNESNITEAQFIKGQMPGGQVITAKETTALQSFTSRIDAMQSDKIWGNEASARTQAIKFINDLRVSQDISEKDYTTLLADYNKRVGIDVSGVTGNYTKGIMYNQEAQVGVAIGQIFGGDDSDEQISQDVGNFMLEGQKMYDQAGLDGGMAGAALGMLLVLPVWFRARRGPKGPKLK